MKGLVVFFLFIHGLVIAQDKIEWTEEPLIYIPFDTIWANTKPLGGYKRFQKQLEVALSQADTIGKKHLIQIKNIGFIVSKIGKIDSAWVIYDRRPFYFEIVKQLKMTPWTPAQKDGLPVASHQELRLDLYLTKKVLKKNRF